MSNPAPLSLNLAAVGVLTPGGVGLGMYLCQLVAQAHGSRLEVRHAEPGLSVQLLLK